MHYGVLQAVANMKPFNSGYRKLSELPNQDGFVFVGVLNDWSERKCTIRKDADGLHRAYDDNGSCFPSLQCWKRAAQ